MKAYVHFLIFNPYPHQDCQASLGCLVSANVLNPISPFLFFFLLLIWVHTSLVSCVCQTIAVWFYNNQDLLWIRCWIFNFLQTGVCVWSVLLWPWGGVTEKKPDCGFGVDCDGSHFCWLRKDPVCASDVADSAALLSTPAAFFLEGGGVGGWMGLKAPSLRLCMLLKPGRTMPPSQGDRLGGSCIVEGRQARHTFQPPHPTTTTTIHTHTPHPHNTHRFTLTPSLCTSFVGGGLNYSSSLVAFRMTNCGPAD